MSNKIKPVSNSSADWAASHEALAPAEELLERMALGRRREVLWVGRWTSTGSLFMLMQEVLIGLDGYYKKKVKDDGRPCVGRGCPERVEVEKLGGDDQVKLNICMYLSKHK